MDQLDIFSLMYPKYQINKPIRLIELFAGIGSQAKALKRLGANFEHYKVVEFDKYAIESYNAVHGTNFATSDITKINAEDLEIVDTDKYCYIMTYSFPCQDLSLAGKGKGMKKGAKTRSGLLWEVERILDECNNLPQILLMENVPQVHSEQNMNDFTDWQNKLESLGYQNYWQDLNAKDYGIPQNRNRCFMLSILGDYCYNFPKPFEIKLRLKDMLEDEVDEKYYLSNKMIDYISANDFKQPKQILIREATKKGYAEATEGDAIRHSYTSNRLNNGIENMSRTESKDKLCPTLDTRCDCLGVVVKGEINVIGNYSPSGHDASRIVHPDGIAPTVKENHSTVTATIVKDTNKVIIAGSLEGGNWDKIHKCCDNIYDKNGISPTLDTMQGGYRQPKIIVTSKNGLKIPLYIGTKHLKETKEQNDLYKGQPLNLDLYNRSAREYIQTLTDHKHNTQRLWDGLRIRKLTPKECWRLMGFDDKDFDKAAKVNSNAQLYKQAGNSIVVNVLECIFKELL